MRAGGGANGSPPIRPRARSPDRATPHAHTRIAAEPSALNIRFPEASSKRDLEDRKDIRVRALDPDDSAGVESQPFHGRSARASSASVRARSSFSSRSAAHASARRRWASDSLTNAGRVAPDDSACARAQSMSGYAITKLTLMRRGFAGRAERATVENAKSPGKSRGGDRGRASERSSGGSRPHGGGVATVTGVNAQSPEAHAVWLAAPSPSAPWVPRPQQTTSPAMRRAQV